MVGAYRGPFAARPRDPCGRAPPPHPHAGPAGRVGRARQGRRAGAKPLAVAAGRPPGATPCRAFLKIDPQTVRK
ncbi:hypothetical protein WS92_15100 [Burkholderia sp. MSMB1588]|nr:hypothetical protein WS92_15100 [Burkholderia sp. MSMB1588]